jgi:hypothetical protein
LDNELYNQPKRYLCLFEEKRANMADFIVRTQGIDRAVALGAAKAMMRNLPTWNESQ